MSDFNRPSYGNGGGNFRPQRQIFDVSDLGIKCAECQKDVKELPFKPTNKGEGMGYGKIYCRECNKAKMQRRDNFDR